MRQKKKKININCVFCKSSVEVTADTKSILCGRCVSRLVGSPAEIGKKPTDTTTPKVKKEKKAKKVQTTTGARAGYGRGWHLKKHFEAPDGKVYSFGELVKK